jgi:hypothetical protein
MLGAFRIAAEAHPVAPGSWTEYSESSYHYDPRFEAIGPGTRLHGYFQSELYFAPYRDALRRELQPAVPLSASFHALSARIAAARNPVSLHLRRGDFAADPHTRRYHGLCGPDHYTRAMRIVAALSEDRPTHVVFSDDPAEARAMFGHMPDTIFADTPPQAPWEDLFLMAQCRHHILANSSFSWWGAWLNPSPGKIVVAPRRWVSAETMRQLNTADVHADGTILI